MFFSRLFGMGGETMRKMREQVLKFPTLTAKQLKAKIPGLALLSIRQIQSLCLEKLDLPSRMMACNPLINERMKHSPHV